MILLGFYIQLAKGLKDCFACSNKFDNDIYVFLQGSKLRDPGSILCFFKQSQAVAAVSASLHGVNRSTVTAEWYNVIAGIFITVYINFLFTPRVFSSVKVKKSQASELKDPDEAFS